MNRHAIIQNGKVANIFTWDETSPWTPPAGSTVVRLSDGEWCGPGATYAPNSVPRFVAAPRSITRTSYEFLNRFTKQERKSIRNKAKTDDDVADFEMLATAAQEILSDDPMTVAGMDYLVSVGIITEARKNQILAP